MRTGKHRFCGWKSRRETGKREAEGRETAVVGFPKKVGFDFSRHYISRDYEMTRSREIGFTNK